jgi:hypothetical protein
MLATAISMNPAAICSGAGAPAPRGAELEGGLARRGAELEGGLARRSAKREGGAANSANPRSTTSRSSG